MPSWSRRRSAWRTMVRETPKKSPSPTSCSLVPGASRRSRIACRMASQIRVSALPAACRRPAMVRPAANACGQLRTQPRRGSMGRDTGSDDRVYMMLRQRCDRRTPPNAALIGERTRPVRRANGMHAFRAAIDIGHVRGEDSRRSPPLAPPPCPPRAPTRSAWSSTANASTSTASRRRRRCSTGCADRASSAARRKAAPRATAAPARSCWPSRAATGRSPGSRSTPASACCRRSTARRCSRSSRSPRPTAPCIRSSRRWSSATARSAASARPASR